MKDPTADNGSGNLLQYIASVTKLMQISVLLSIVTSVGFSIIETAVTNNQNAINVMKEDSNKIDPSVNSDNDAREVINLFGTTGRKAAERSILHNPDISIM